MNYNCTFLNNIHGIEFNTEELLLSEELQIKISNEEQFLKDFFTQETVSIVGAGNSVSTMKMKTYIYNVFTVSKDTFKEEQLLSYLLKCCTILSNALWLIKDNSVRFNIGHLKYTDNITVTVHSNFVNSIYTNLIGEKNTTKFSREEIIEAIKYFSFFFNLYSKSKKDEDIHAEVDRMTRAFYFIDLARKNYNIGMKISLHCSAFECLFSISSSP